MAGEKKPLDELKESIVLTAAEVVVGLMTPAQMRKISEQIIEEALSRIRTDEYSNLGRMIESKLLKEYLATDETTTSFRLAIRQGVDEALKEMSEQVNGKVVDIALDGVVKALNARR